MKIIIMRHAKVHIKNKKIYANELKKAIHNYDISPIDTNIKNREELIKVANSCNYFISSGLKRSVDTLILLGKESDYSDKIFLEVEFPYISKRIMKLHLLIWAFIFRIVWFMGFSGNSKSYKESKVEAFEASKILIDLANKYSSVLLVGHGLKNNLIAKSLKKQGWSKIKKVGLDNLSYGIFEFNGD